MNHVRHAMTVDVVLMVAGTGAGKTLHVPTADYPTVQAAIDAADSGDKIMVAPGTHTENIWWILEGKDYPRFWWELVRIDDR